MNNEFEFQLNQHLPTVKVVRKMIGWKSRLMTSDEIESRRRDDRELNDVRTHTASS